jgi:hypothetical protein
LDFWFTPFLISSFIIEQKERLFINRMNLYFHEQMKMSVATKIMNLMFW